MKFRIKFKISIIAIMVLMVVLVSGSVSALFWTATSHFSNDLATRSFDSKTDHAVTSVNGLLNLASSNAAIGAKQDQAWTLPQQFLNASRLPFLIETLAQNPSFYSVYYGFDDDSFFQVIATRGDGNILKRHKAPKGTAWIVRAITPGAPRLQHWAYLDENLNKLGRHTEQDPTYLPTKRPWYGAARGMNEVSLSEPYWFNSLQQPGITASKIVEGGDGVYGVDLTLTGLGEELSEIQISENGILGLLDRNNRILALSPTLSSDLLMKPLEEQSETALAPLKSIWTELQNMKLQEFQFGRDSYFAEKDKISFQGTELYLAIIAPTNDFSDLFGDFQKHILIVSLATLGLFIPFSFLFAARLSKKVTELTSAAEQVRDMNFDVNKIDESRIVEFDDLIKSFSTMSTSLGEKTEALHAEQEKLSKLVELGISMSSEKSGDKLMEMVMIGAKELTNADGCSLYVLNDNQELEFKIFRNDTLGMVYGGTSGKEVNFPGIPLYDDHGEPNMTNVVSYTVHKEESVNIADVHNSKRFDFTGPKSFDEKMGYESKSILTVPLKPRGGAVIGALQIINAQEKYADEYVAFGKDIQPFVEALAAQASTSLYNRQLLAAQENLMDALIQLIAGAIDAKSPYTGGHCERVPELAMMLAKKASDATNGSFADFAFKTHDEWREFEIGAWLHDCGKVVTPEYVVDKATKLETIYNRIHEVRTRFEVLLRDARITYLEAVAGGIDEKTAKTEFEATKQKLFDDFAFVAECNVGGEFMSDDAIARLKKIAKIQWKRHFDIHMGLSHEEAKRFVDEPHGECLEYLLDDKAFHVFPRNEGVKELYANRGFKLDVPDNLYDQGEVYNLSVQRGTLNDEERFKINEHIMQSIAMLEQLPLPDHLKRVPEYAGTHHETMIGTGYPRKLSADDLSIPSRIMAIADIFEALTASDRPYKKAKTLSESIKILSFFKKDQHIDGELFDLFLTSGIYKDYANRFLLPEQIDEVDIEAYLG